MAGRGRAQAHLLLQTIQGGSKERARIYIAWHVLPMPVQVLCDA
jgi:hypothetical protein